MMSTTVLLAFLAGLLIVVVIGKVMLVPLRYLVKLIANGIIGGILLWIINIVGAGFSIHVPINVVTALIAGFLGIPGVVLLIALKAILT